MAVDKLVDSTKLDSDLTSVANAIRSKSGGSGQLAFPAGFVSAINGISTKETDSWHQCPEVVRNYIAAAQAAYPSDDTVTVIDDYAPARGSELVSNTKPVGKVIDGTTFYNNVPNVATPFATTNKAGTMTALDVLRWVNTTSAAIVSGETYSRGINTRDLGGWACDGGTVRYGLLIRGGEPNPADKALMVDKIGIKTEVQLLPVSEQATGYKKTSAWGIDWAGNDTENGSVYTINDSKTLWKKLLEPIIDSVIHSKPVYFHCGIGADRTGIIAIALESLLGMSRSDIDIEYELTNFANGWQSLTGGIYRARTYTAYQSMVTAVGNVPLATGLSDSWRNRWVSFVLTCGISIDKINAFRAAMIDGTPETITVTVPTYTITNTLSNVSNSNAAVSIDQYGQYSATLTADTGYAISAVTLTMGGVNYTADYYANGAINIPIVTGNIVITATATAIVRENLLTMNDGKINIRLNSSGQEKTQNGYFVTDYFAFDYAAATGLRIVDGYLNNSTQGTNAYGTCFIACYNASKDLIGLWYMSRRNAATETLMTVDGNDFVKADLDADHGASCNSIAAISDWSTVKFIRLSLALNNAAAAIGSVSDVTGSGMKIYAE